MFSKRLESLGLFPLVLSLSNRQLFKVKTSLFEWKWWSFHPIPLFEWKKGVIWWLFHDNLRARGKRNHKFRALFWRSLFNFNKPKKQEIIRKFEKFWKKSFGFGKKPFGSDSGIVRGPWFPSHTTLIIPLSYFYGT